jgi:hypothetical protein
MDMLLRCDTICMDMSPSPGPSQSHPIPVQRHPIPLQHQILLQGS